MHRKQSLGLCAEERGPPGKSPHTHHLQVPMEFIGKISARNIRRRSSTCTEDLWHRSALLCMAWLGNAKSYMHFVLGQDIYFVEPNIILHLFIKELGSIPSMSFILLVQSMYSIQSVLLELSPLQVQDSEWQPIQQYP